VESRDTLGQEVNLPAPDVQSVKFRGGRVTFLSDLVPSKVEEAPSSAGNSPTNATSLCSESRSG